MSSMVMSTRVTEESPTPAGNGTGSARAVAKLYGSAATGEPKLGLSQIVRDALGRPAVPPTKGLRDVVLKMETSFSLGFGKPFPRYVFGSSDRAFGWNGAGGSFGFADPDTGIGFGYVMNKLGYHAFSDPRELNFGKPCSATCSGRELRSGRYGSAR